MARSKQSQYLLVQTAWINYQEKFLGVAEIDLSTEPPQQFKDIFWQGHAYGMVEARRSER